MLELLHQVAQALALLAASQLAPSCPTQVYYHANAWEDGSFVAYAICNDRSDQTGWEYPAEAYWRDPELNTIYHESSSMPDAFELPNWVLFVDNAPINRHGFRVE